MRMAELLKEAGLPDGVFNVVHGDKEAVDALLDASGRSRRSRSSARRRSRDTSTRRATRHGKRVQALGGAKNHAVVLPDADLEFAAEALDRRGLRLGGRALHGDLGAWSRWAPPATQLVDELAAEARAIKVGPGDAAGVDMGPLVTARASRRVKGYIDAGVPGRREAGGRRPRPHG